MTDHAREAAERKFADELRRWWRFDDRQVHIHSWHDREDFIEKRTGPLIREAIDAATKQLHEHVRIYEIKLDEKTAEIERLRAEIGSMSQPCAYCGWTADDMLGHDHCVVCQVEKRGMNPAKDWKDD